jgi:hypothetical protein
MKTRKHEKKNKTRKHENTKEQGKERKKPKLHCSNLQRQGIRDFNIAAQAAHMIR